MRFFKDRFSFWRFGKGHYSLNIIEQAILFSLCFVVVITTNTFADAIWWQRFLISFLAAVNFLLLIIGELHLLKMKVKENENAAIAKVRRRYIVFLWVDYIALFMTLATVWLS